MKNLQKLNKKEIIKISVCILIVVSLIGSIIYQQLIIYKNDKTIYYTTEFTKSLLNDLAYNSKTSQERYAHFSIDDSFEIFSDLTNNETEYDSIFKNRWLSFYKHLHDTYGVVITCYVYYENGDINLSGVTDKFKKEFQENSSWLKFGFHSYGANDTFADTSAQTAKEQYDTVINELLRITGSEQSIDRVIRLHYYAGNAESIEAIRDTENGVVGLLSADDDRISYYLNDTENEFLRQVDRYVDWKKHMAILPTDFRIEKIENADEIISDLDAVPWNSGTDELIFFTHEWALFEDGNKEKVETICKKLFNHDYSFDFPMNRTANIY